VRVVVAGQKRFGRDVLNLCASRDYQIAAVSCPVGGDDKLWIAAQNLDVPVIPSGQLTADRMPADVTLIVAAHCHDYLSRKTRDRAELGALGYHPSLLPRHRGRSAIEWAVRMREPLTGGTAYWMNDVVDGGPIAAQDFVHIRPGDTARDLWARDLAPMGLRLFAQVFDALDRGVVLATDQDTELATWEPAVDKVPPLWRPDVPRLGFSRFARQAAGSAPAEPLPKS
jgi:methionyl-tRNA formyltransferase